jgi:hypothetical protein
MVTIFLVDRMDKNDDVNIVVDVEKIECIMKDTPYYKMKFLLEKNCGECHDHSYWMKSQEDLDNSIVEQYLIYGSNPLRAYAKAIGRPDIKDQIHQMPKEDMNGMISYFCVPLIEKMRIYK